MGGESVGITMSRRGAAIFAWVSLFLIVAAPVAADSGDRGQMHDHDNDRHTTERRGKDLNPRVHERDDQPEVREICSAAFHPLTDVDVNSGTIVGGPYDGWP